MEAIKMTSDMIDYRFVVRVSDYMPRLPRPRRRLMTGDGEILKPILISSGEDPW